MTVGKAVDAILVSFLFLAMAFGAAGQVRAQTSPEQAAQFVAALGHEAVGLQAATKAQPPEKRMARDEAENRNYGRVCDVGAPRAKGEDG